RSNTRLRLLRLTEACMKDNGGSVPGKNGGRKRDTSPPAGSTLITSAPRSASKHPHIGPAQVVVASSTVTPASGPVRSVRASAKKSHFFIARQCYQRRPCSEQIGLRWAAHETTE